MNELSYRALQSSLPVSRNGSRDRIAFVAASQDILGGHSIQALTLMGRLRSEGYEVTLIPINPRFPRGLSWLRRFHYVRTAFNQGLYLPSLFRLRHADVVHVFSASYWSFLLSPSPAMLVGKLLRKRVILNYHSGEAEDHLDHWGALVHPWLRLADEIVVPSEYLRGIFSRHGYRVRVVHNIIEPKNFPYRERKPLRPRLLSTRNLEPHYRVGDILRAFALLRGRYPDATLLIVGSGSEEARLRRLSGSLGARGIRFVGRVEPDRIPALYDEADIFLNTSVVDNQPLSVAEAFASGLAVVSTGTGDLASMVRDEETGLVVPPRDPRAVARAVSRLLEDPDRAVALARQAHEEVENYTWERVREQWASVYAAGGFHECC